ncbi:protein of unknown function DUF262 [Solidesulfovibrio fructosivorans JJ]]|uniref:GmrSD restriction endonucleases N-terminal domain-containing protein n=1 Tax=Solidesulfovibrio fructosivorans JJ] TaxID=596151 RepID=E1K2D4_SOLFR|nr:DUF262 domain-containing protein [Solidesulfovibrio fructosivorans]EFL49220.1 protein of unknown function DUF262 [Solidesulfovibrio fructosivorans JJ]]
MASRKYDINEFEEEEGKDYLTKGSPEPIEEIYKKGKFRVVYQTNTFFLPQLRDLIRNKSILNIRPEYQRRLRWDNKRKSLLIESLLMNIPIPPLFFYENKMATYEVMDGQQRLNAIDEFFNNDFKLTGLEVFGQLKGKQYGELHPVIKKGLDRASLSSIILLLESDDTERDPYLIRRYVFKRLNTGGQKLNDQEIRNCIYAGEFNNLITSLSRNSLFTKAWDIPPFNEIDIDRSYEDPKRKNNTLYRNMHDCQLILRFFALKDEENIKGSMKSMLDRCMQKNLNITPEEKLNYEYIFLECLELAHLIFNRRPFKIKTGKVEKVSAPLYDATMVSLSKFLKNKSTLIEKKAFINERLQKALNNANDYEILVGRGNTASAIKKRIELLSGIFKLAIS